MKQSDLRPSPVVDPAFEQALNAYIENAIEQAKKEYQPGLEPFAAKAEKIRLRITEWFQSYRSAYLNGYRVLLDELAKTLPENDLALFKLGEESCKVLNDPDAFFNALSEGKSINQILGFSDEAVSKFYETANHLLQEKCYSEAKDAFFFLVTIIPNMSPCWLGLGYSYMQCGENEAALVALSRALELDPANADHYLTFARIFIQMKDFSKAKQVCSLGLIYASENPNQPGVGELKAIMEEAKHQIDEQAKKAGV